MKYIISAIFLISFSVFSFADYKIIGNSTNKIKIPEPKEDPFGWELVYSQRNFNFTDGSIDLSTLPDRDKFKFQHSSDLYFVFNGNIKTSELKTYGDRNVWNINNAIEVINNENIPLGAYVTIMENSISQSISPIFIGNNSHEPWCSIVHGKYNGVCSDGSYGKGDWDIYLAPEN